ncbi:hypothetical protein J1614_007775 [Plenodomus biglobosus]|nr:hypothetical protein J1614_007775 [Plenodomus biglobosus]
MSADCGVLCDQYVSRDRRTDRVSLGHSAPRFTAEPVDSEALVSTILIIPASNGSTNHTSSQVTRNGESAACICEVLTVEKLEAMWRRPKSSRI